MPENHRTTAHLPLPDAVACADLIQNLAVGVILLDPDGAVSWLSTPAAQLLGHTSPRSLRGKPIRSLLSIDPDALRDLLAAARAAVSADTAPPTTRRFPLVHPATRTGDAAFDLTASVLTLPSSPQRRAVVLTLTDASPRQTAETEAARLRERLAESERARIRLRSLQEGLSESASPPVIVGDSHGLRRVREQIARVAPSDTTVLIHGETGTGKELVARAIHAESARTANAFIAVNCAALPESLIESELFGHERGAFTGADRRRLGKFELADGGTVFLDEIAELPLAAQAKLLRVLNDGAFQRVGGSETIRVDARVVAATHRDLARRVTRGLFREDLFYRLNVFRIEVPPLRDRREDIRPLAEYLHRTVARRMAKPVLPLSDQSIRRLMAYRWPGNIRELANAVERATLLADGPDLEIELPDSPGGVSPAPARDPTDAEARPATRDILLDLTMEQLQRLHIMHALESCGYRVFGPDGAAARLEMNPNTLLSRMDRFGIPRPRTVRKRRPPGQPESA